MCLQTRSGIVGLLAGLLVSALPTFAFVVQIDYSYDADTLNGGLDFFDTGTANGLLARNALDAAADELESWLNDSFDAISPGGGNSWEAEIFSPVSSGTDRKTILDLFVPVDTIIIFAGAFTGGDSQLLGQGSKGGFTSNSSGSASFLNGLVDRGGNSEFVMWGGMIRFKADRPDWHLDASAPVESGKFDFYSTALHELAHAIGFGQATTWTNQVSGATFTGSNAVEVYNRTDADTGNDTNPVPLGGALPYAHWDDSLTSIVASDGMTVQETLMGPTLAPGDRLELTELDLAGLADLGWEVTGINAIPEPRFVSVLLGGCALIFVARRRRKTMA